MYTSLIQNLGLVYFSEAKEKIRKSEKVDFGGEGGGNRKKLIRPFLCAIKFAIDTVVSEFEISQKWRS